MVPNHLLDGMILQVPSLKLTASLPLKINGWKNQEEKFVEWDFGINSLYKLPLGCELYHTYVRYGPHPTHSAP